MLEQNKGLTILSEVLAYERYVKVWHREVEFPDKTVHSWDVVGHSIDAQFCVVMTFNTRNKTTNLVIEYSQGTNDMHYTFASGAYEPTKHGSMLDAAKDELSEEAALKHGEWIPLVGADGAIAELKWGRNRFVPYLVLDPVDDECPKPRDAEELMQVRRGVTMEELKGIVLGGKLRLPSVQTWVMGEEVLRRRGLL
ncbi:hypothetical protein SeMB42_g01230 [Synchytrium endobioticum]|uniref:Nudix hydrolase domain-containing protein n=1 Tax=Synchytrium endobioticum TaxID=286115 RepID=A0A507DHA5_9FUNG|nr:hypothetical protein SeLEV6574_g00710 [Synchytrium endobioticum]TPX52695.1 hypothetical protein SeMB42_g01230 [Synchytrium endobioticum]